MALFKFIDCLAIGAMPIATTVVVDAPMITMITSFFMSTKMSSLALTDEAQYRSLLA